MSETLIRTDIKNAINGVRDAGIVHDYERIATTWDAYLNFFKAAIDGFDRIRGWVITCNNIPLTKEQFESGWRTTYEYVIRGYFGLSDADETEKSALKKAVEVRDALRDATSLIASGRTMQLPQMAFENRLFGDVLCHVAEITISITENG